MRPSSSLLAGLALPRTIRAILASNASASTSSASASASAPSSTAVHGWIKSARHHKNVSFFEVADGTSAQGLQVVVRRQNGGGSELSEAVAGLTIGTSVRFDGILQPSRGTQALELAVQRCTVLGPCDPETYPIQNKPTPSALLRDAHAHLRFRTGAMPAVTRLRDGLMRNWADWFEENEFTHIHTPTLTSSDCEGAGETFRVMTAEDLACEVARADRAHRSSSKSAGPPDAPALSSPAPSTPDPFFPSPAHLTVSAQLHLEAPTHALSRTYTLSPTFRAEPSATSRHLAEFVMLEAEVAWVGGLGDVMDTLEHGLKGALRPVVRREGRGARCADELNVIRKALEENGEWDGRVALDEAFLERPFGRMTYTEAVEILQRRHAEEPFVHPPLWGASLQSEHEKYLAGTVHGGPMFVTEYPTALKPFYMRANDDPAVILPHVARAPDLSTTSTVACFDLLIPGLGELAGGSLREERLPQLRATLDAHGMDERAYTWYTDLRRWGTVPHGGWGMGWERFVCWVSGVGNVRDVVAFPRWKGHCRY